VHLTCDSIIILEENKDIGIPLQFIPSFPLPVAHSLPMRQERQIRPENSIILTNI
jgi:hypothetical protein